MNLITTHRSLRSELLSQKYTLIPATDLTFDSELVSEEKKLWADWEDLETDEYLRNGGQFRLRRLGLFYFMPATDELLMLSANTYFQASEINTYAGGVQRKYPPLSEATRSNRFLKELIGFNFRQLPTDDEAAMKPWKVDIHQVRIVTTPAETGEPTPEGIHHDGEEFVCIHLVSRRNVDGGLTTIHDNDGGLLESFMLREPMDSAILWDPHVMHGVTPIQPENPEEPGIRDVLLMGYDSCPDLERPN